MFKLPPVMLTDSYKSSHYKLYPPNCQQITAYGEFRQPFERDQVDTRILFYGIRYIIETHLARKWTLEDLRQSELFFRFHNSGKTQFPFPADLIRKFICEGGDGYFPVKIESLREGETVYPHVPVYQITACKEYAPLCTWLETLMTMIWYPVTVCTLSRRAKELIRSAFDQSVDPDHHWLIDSRLHDFGFRGCTSVEQSVIGGSAHLVNFEGSDTMSAAYYAQMHLNEGRPVATSIPATEHSIMTSWMTEREAIDCLIEEFGSGVFACVMDSYDYARALSEVLPSIATKKLSKGGLMVLRPDSGDPVETVLMALRAGEKVFGASKNGKGYKVIQGCSVIQGDGINSVSMKKILDAVLAQGFSAENVAFGMGGGLLQKVNRDTMSFATKVCHIVYSDGGERDIMKMPTTDSQKFSLPGRLKVVRSPETGIPIVYPADSTATGGDSGSKRGDGGQEDEMFHVVYDHGKVCEWDSFDQIRERANRTWNMLPKKADVVSEKLQQKIEFVIERQRRWNKQNNQ